MHELDINTLHQLAKQGDPAAEKSLFECLSVRFRLFARRRLWGQAEWEDIAQEALATVCREYKNVDITVSFGAWAYQILRHKLLTHVQTKRRREQRTIRIEEVEETAAAETGVDPLTVERLLRCLQEVGQANTRYARALNLQYQGFTVEEICTKMHLTRNNFYTLLSRARVMLDNCLHQGEHD